MIMTSDDVNVFGRFDDRKIIKHVNHFPVSMAPKLINIQWIRTGPEPY